MAGSQPPPPSQPAPARQGQPTGEVSGYRVSADTVEGFREDDYSSASNRSKSGNKTRSSTRQPQTVGSIPDPEGWINS